MATLTGSTIASSYDQLLALPSGGGNGSTLVALTDGNAGNTFALQVSTGEVKSTGTLNVAGITTATGGVVGDLTGDVTGDLTGNITATSVLADGVVATTQAVDNDSTKVATTAFVVAQVETSDTLAEVLANGNTTGSTNIIVSASQSITTDTVSETTSAAGVTIDSVLVKDNSVTATTFTGALVGNADTATTVATVTGATQAAITSAANLVTVGTIGSGTWAATDVAVLHGGTGSSTASGARTNLGVAIGSDVQAYNGNLTDIASAVPGDNNFIVGNGSDWIAEGDSTARISLGVAIGSDVQAWDAELDTLAALTEARGSLIVGNSTPAWSALAVGSANTVLTSDGTDAAWAAVSNTMLTNSAVTVGSTSISLGATATTIAGLTSVTSTTFVGALTGNCTGNAATVTNGVYTTNNLSVLAATTSSQLAGVISDETGSGSLVFATSPTLVTPALGTPASGVLTNCTGTASGLTAGTVTTNANLTGDVTSSGNATTIATDAVDIAMLSATGTASSSTYLRGDNTWAATSGSGVSIGDTITSATEGSVLFAGASGVLAQDNDKLFWDASAVSLGIGTAAPTKGILDCRGSVASTLDIGADDSAQVIASFLASSSPRQGRLKIAGTNTPSSESLALISDASADAGFAFVTSSGGTLAERVVIDKNGKVGIGVIDPDSELEINGQIKITGGVPGADKVLTSDADGLATWETASGGSGNLTTKGDLEVYTTSQTRLGVGTNGDTLTADSTAASGVAWKAPMLVTTITSGTSSTISENGTDQLIKVNIPEAGASYALTLPRPSAVPAGRKIQLWVEALNSQYFSAGTSSASDLFVLSSDIYSGTTPDRYAESYGVETPILTLVSDGILSWYSDNASYSNAWYAIDTPT